MLTKNLQFILEKLPTIDTPVAAAIAKSTEVGIIVPSILRTNLQSAGYSIITDTAAHEERGFPTLKFLTRVLVEDADGNLIAMGAASDLDEALLHAMLGYIRENAPAGE